MENISIRAVTARAPAARSRRNAKGLGIINTADVLKYVEETRGMLPVLAVQGTPHVDAGDDAPPENCRHLVVAANANGIAFAMVNDHSKDRRTHMGVGFWDSGALLVGASNAVQRWRGYEDPIETLMESGVKMMEVVNESRSIKDTVAARFARHMAKHGYMASVGARPSIAALLAGYEGTKLYTLATHILRRMREGNLENGSPNGLRRVKKVRRPDAIFHAGSVAFAYMVQELNTRGGSFDFGRLKDRLIRP